MFQTPYAVIAGQKTQNIGIFRVLGPGVTEPADISSEITRSGDFSIPIVDAKLPGMLYWASSHIPLPWRNSDFAVFPVHPADTTLSFCTNIFTKSILS